MILSAELTAAENGVANGVLSFLYREDNQYRGEILLPYRLSAVKGLAYLVTS